MTLQGPTLGYMVLQEFTGVYKGLTGVTRGYSGLKGVTGVTWGYKGLQRIT